jgi:hypothetical protein
LQIHISQKSVGFRIYYIITSCYLYSTLCLSFILGVVLSLYISLASAEQLTLTWDDPHNDSAEVGSYRLYYWQPTWDVPAHLDVGKQTTYTLMELESGQNYSFAVTVHDGKGGRESPLSKTVSKSFSSTTSTTAYDLDQRLGLENDSGNYYENWGGLDEKWMQSSSGIWYFITPDGSLYEWNGDSDLSTSTLIATLDSTYHTDPTTLHDAPDPNTGGGGPSLEQIAYDLDQQLSLGHDGNDYKNWGGLDEKWMQSSSGKWYFITPDGSLYEWNGDSDLSTSTLIATLDSTYYDDTSKLHNAPTP